MFSVWKWRLVAFTRKLWVRSSLYALLGVLTALVAVVAEPFLPAGAGADFGAGSVETILNILASSLLTVITFSLGIMVSALAGATQTATPRAVAILMEDTTTQNMLATFLGSFLFSLVGIIGLKAGVYNAGGRLVLFAMTLVVVAVIVAAMLRWIAHLSDFGRMRDVLQRLENTAGKAMKARMTAPYLGGHPLRKPPPRRAHPVFPDIVGYVQHLDAGALQQAAEAIGAQVYVKALPGALVTPATPLCFVDGDAEVLQMRRFAAAFTLGPARHFEQDPRFGLQVLAEVASRALSPAVNDPGTAIDVLGRAVRLLAPWGQEREVSLDHPRLWVPEIQIEDMFEDVFRPIARDGAALVEVQVRLQKALAALAQIDREDFGRAAARQSSEALQRAEVALTIEADRELLRALNAGLKGDPEDRPAPGI